MIRASSLNWGLIVDDCFKFFMLVLKLLALDVSQTWSTKSAIDAKTLSIWMVKTCANARERFEFKSYDG